MKKFLIACSALFAMQASAEVNHEVFTTQLSELLWDVREQLVADVRSGRDTDVDIEKTILCENADGDVIDGEHITIHFRTDGKFEQQLLRLVFAYSSWIVGSIGSIDIHDDEDIVGCRLEDGFVEIPEFEEEVLISSK